MARIEPLFSDLVRNRQADLCEEKRRSVRTLIGRDDEGLCQDNIQLRLVELNALRKGRGEDAPAVVLRYCALIALETSRNSARASEHK
jgi:hypothetical protein